MFKTSKKAATIRVLTLKAATEVGAKGRIKIHMELDQKQIAQVPHVAEVVAELVKVGKAYPDDEDGPNSLTLQVKRDWPVASYTFRYGDDSTTLKGVSVALKPHFMIVEGEPTVTFQLDADIPSDEMASLAGMVGVEGMTLTIKPAQQAIDFSTPDNVTAIG